MASKRQWKARFRAVCGRLRLVRKELDVVREALPGPANRNGQAQPESELFFLRRRARELRIELASAREALGVAEKRCVEVMDERDAAWVALRHERSKVEDRPASRVNEEVLCNAQV